ncbi:MAG: response regulator transcription factor [Thermoleophilaceae bacterium]|nr:response regulator transcription factor [Thermoleophilaceae bacterium]
MSIRVAVCDDQGMVRSGIRSLLSGEPEIDVVAEASDGEQAVAAARRFEPDVILMDIRMPEMDGLAATRRILGEGSESRILILTTFDLDEYVFEALRAGASAFLLKDASADELIDAVRLIARGDALLAPAVTRRVIEAFAEAPQPDHKRAAALAELSDREREVLRLVGRGLSNAEIAERLTVSLGTVKSHVSSILTKANLRDRVQAVVFAYESGLLRAGEADTQ